MTFRKYTIAYLCFLVGLTIGSVVGVECMAFTARKVVVHEIKVWARRQADRATRASHQAPAGLDHSASIARADRP